MVGSRGDATLSPQAEVKLDLDRAHPQPFPPVRTTTLGGHLQPRRDGPSPSVAWGAAETAAEQERQSGRPKRQPIRTVLAARAQSCAGLDTFSPPLGTTHPQEGWLVRMVVEFPIHGKVAERLGITHTRVDAHLAPLLAALAHERGRRLRWTAQHRGNERKQRPRSSREMRSPYARLVVGAENLYMHRVIWEKEIGPIPHDHDVDHINGDRLDNRLVNLRVLPISVNRRRM
jgi:hypothetical protein